jgi:hypothetical protein
MTNCLQRWKAETMAWKVYGAMHGRDAQTGFPIVYGPLPRKRWVPAPGDRKHRVKRGAAGSVTGRASVKEYTAERAEIYARWLAQRDGVAIPNDYDKVAAVWSSVGVPGKPRPEPRVCAVTWTKHEWSARDGHTTTELLRIAIPNWDWVPFMTEEQIKVAA